MLRAGKLEKLGVSYVANAGHALTSDNATNATKINGHGLVRFDTAELEAAVKLKNVILRSVRRGVILCHFMRIVSITLFIGDMHLLNDGR